MVKIEKKNKNDIYRVVHKKKLGVQNQINKEIIRKD